MTDKKRDPLGDYTEQQLDIAAVELRLLGIDHEIVHHYRHCGDWSVISLMQAYEYNKNKYGHDEAVKRMNERHHKFRRTQ